MRIVFMGSPEFAVSSLQSLNDHYNVVGVVTQPDRRAGRGRKLTAGAVKRAALELNLPVLQPIKLREKEAVDQLSSLNPDLIVVTAYGQILPTSVLKLPRFGCINVHASLLPRWRGASPIQTAIHAGDSETGITIMKMDSGLDTGPIIIQSVKSIAPTITGGELSASLAQLGAETLLRALPCYLSGDLVPIAQGPGETYAPLLKKTDGLLNFNQAAVDLVRHVRAYQPWPGTYFFLGDQRIAVHAAEISPGNHDQSGQALIIDHLPAISTADGYLLLTTLQPAGKKAIEGRDFLRGAKTFSGEVLKPD